MRIALGSDHAGLALRRVLAGGLFDKGFVISEFGAKGEEAYDYPDAATAVARQVLDGKADVGVLVCGTGIGMSMAANRIRGVRAAVCWNEDSARLTREHNHANVLCLGSRLIEPGLAAKILDAFLATEPSSESRHSRRVEKIDAGSECKV